MRKLINVMKYAHKIKLNVFSYEHEDRNSVLESFLGFFPFSLEENKVILKNTKASGFNEKKIEIFEAALTKDSLIKQFLNSLLNNLSEVQKGQLLQQAESRLDADLNFFIRFDKDLWIKDRKLFLTDSGKCFHLKMSVAAFPRKREVALNAVKELFSK